MYEGEVIFHQISYSRGVIFQLLKTAFQSIEDHHNTGQFTKQIDVANCCGQAYDTTASMSSDKKGVQGTIAEFHDCVLQSLNIVICHACKIKSIQNMMDSCHELKDVRAHYELCAVIPTVSVTIMSSESMTELANILQQKWDHVFPVSSAFENSQDRSPEEHAPPTTLHSGPQASKLRKPWQKKHAKVERHSPNDANSTARCHYRSCKASPLVFVSMAVAAHDRAKEKLIKQLLMKFSATSHGKGIIDGIGGRAKYLVRHKVMSKSSTPNYSEFSRFCECGKPTHGKDHCPIWTRLSPMIQFF
ncbi:hypothetical protein GQR58_011307 [Nymphon striatum]|nr:hypothetical protein GQR58_011307 [Nymphon striatum]